MARFDDLPPELVGAIWSFLGTDTARRRHLCKTAVPYVRCANLGRTYIHSPEQLFAFDRLLKPLANAPLDAQHLGHYVEELFCPEIEYSRHKPSEIAATRRILERCDKITSLCGNNSGLLRVLLPAKRGTLRFPYLERLLIDDLDGTFSPLFDMERFAHLRRFPSLRAVALHVSWEWDEDLESVARPLKVPDILHVESLALTAADVLSAPGTANFVAHFARLKCLVLTVRGAVELGSFLQACPTSIRDLTVQLPEDWDDDDPVPLNIDADLARFVNLTHLTLGALTYAPTCELFPILAAHLTHLSTLTLLDNTPLVANKLLPFVRARGGPLHSLQRVVIQSFWVHAHPVPSAVPERTDVRDGTFSFSRLWTLARWTRAFTYAHARELLVLAKIAGVKVEGMILEAVAVEELRVREEAYLQERRDDVLYSLRGLFGDGQL
ncbi:hypothetical protein JCM3770_003222 [Rhodotorula araucariae]